MKRTLALALSCLVFSLFPEPAVSQQRTPERYVRPVGYALMDTPAESPREHSEEELRMNRPTEIIQVLNLKLLPKESGYLGLIGSSAQTTDIGGHKIGIQSQVYYMLTSELPVNYLHWLAPDDTHILIEGGPVDYFIFHPDGHVEKITLGLDLAAGQRPVIAVPGGCWKALRLHEGATYALMANALSPEFTPDRVKIGAGAEWLNRYTGAAPWATQANLLALIGPNWTGK